MSDVKPIDISCIVPFDLGRGDPTGTYRDELVLCVGLLKMPMSLVDIDYTQIESWSNSAGEQTIMYRMRITGEDALPTDFLRRLMLAVARTLLGCVEHAKVGGVSIQIPLYTWSDLATWIGKNDRGEEVISIGGLDPQSEIASIRGGVLRDRYGIKITEPVGRVVEALEGTARKYAMTHKLVAGAGVFHMIDELVENLKGNAGKRRKVCIRTKATWAVPVVRNWITKHDPIAEFDHEGNPVTIWVTTNISLDAIEGQTDTISDVVIAETAGMV